MTIVYSSLTGFTAEYAALLHKETGLPAVPLEDFTGGGEILYLGWLRAGGIVGLKAAVKKAEVRGVCAVGMAITGSRLAETRSANGLPVEIPLFTLQGGYAPEKLRGLNRFLMRLVTGKLAKDLLAKENRIPAEEDLLELLQKGGSRVSAEQLGDVLDWLKNR